MEMTGKNSTLNTMQHPDYWDIYLPTLKSVGGWKKQILDWRVSSLGNTSELWRVVHAWAGIACSCSWLRAGQASWDVSSPAQLSWPCLQFVAEPMCWAQWRWVVKWAKTDVLLRWLMVLQQWWTYWWWRWGWFYKCIRIPLLIKYISRVSDYNQLLFTHVYRMFCTTGMK
jgi:hypothetical protein